MPSPNTNLLIEWIAKQDSIQNHQTYNGKFWKPMNLQNLAMEIKQGVLVPNRKVHQID